MQSFAAEKHGWNSSVRDAEPPIFVIDHYPVVTELLLDSWKKVESEPKQGNPNSS